jgi:Zn-dependent M16 (insulinase) family peptidase
MAKEKIHGFTVVSTVYVSSIKTTVIRLIHAVTGCEVVHLVNEDVENFFSFVVNTPCSDDTGVAHIMEHAVLSGSRRFPLKDPFVQLLKGSMKTLMNASTGMDETQYYAASTNENDFFNLMKVYGDAVFFSFWKRCSCRRDGESSRSKRAEASRASR